MPVTAARWEGLLGVVVATLFVLWALRERRRGDRFWWAYILGSAVMYVFSVGAAVTNVSYSG
ncbi:MAG: hypothetical protein J2P45_09810 [Candidatus Dormibacteraeota bacterium]|nr:hypothetical protein [Candidatus Dormibacteraeota bacterium]